MAGIVDQLVNILTGGASQIISGPGDRAASQIGNYGFPNELPDVGAVMEAYRRGLAGPEFARIVARYSGALWVPDQNQRHALKGRDRMCADAWNAIYQAQRPLLTLGEIFALANREIVTAKGVDQTLSLMGFEHEAERKAYQNLRYEVPGPADLVRFAVRHVFEPDLIRHFGYNDEYRPVLDAFHHAQGVDYPIFSGPLKNVVSLIEQRAGLPKGDFLSRYGAAGVGEPTWAQAYWWSHWILPSPGQGYVMRQRLRATGGPNGGPRDPSGQVFSDNDLSLLLRANDYPPYWREKLGAISYRVIGLRQLQQLYRYDLIDRPELIERWMDQGYSRHDGEVLADLVIKTEVRRRFAREGRASRAKITDAYAVGTLSRDDASVALKRLAFEDSSSLADFDALTNQQQITVASEDAPVTLQLEAIDTGLAATDARQTIGIVRKLYLAGRLDAQAVRAALITIGVVSNRIDRYIRVWTDQIGGVHKELTAAQVIGFAKDGIISVDDARARLIRIGYDDADAAYLVAGIERSLRGQAAKAALAQARTLQQQQRALAQVAKAAQSEHRQAVAALAKSGGRSSILKWIVRGLIDPATARKRLLAIGVLGPDADADIRVALQDKAKRDASANKPAKAAAGAGTSSPSANGGMSTGA